RLRDRPRSGGGTGRGARRRGRDAGGGRGEYRIAHGSVAPGGPRGGRVPGSVVERLRTALVCLSTPGKQLTPSVTSLYWTHRVRIISLDGLCDREGNHPHERQGSLHGQPRHDTRRSAGVRGDATILHRRLRQRREPEPPLRLGGGEGGGGCTGRARAADQCQ